MIKKEVLENFTDKNVMITGGTGLIGRQIVDILCSAGAKVLVVSLDNINIDSRAEHRIMDLCDFPACKAVTKGMDHVFHVAGVKGSIEVTRSKPASFLVPLLMMNTNMLEACRVNNVKKVVYTSSIGAYASAEVFKESQNGDAAPMDMFPGWAKRMAEMQINAYKIQFNLSNFAVVRPCNVYGPGDNFDPGNAMVIPSLMSRIHRGEDPVLIWGDGSSIRDFAYSRDVAEGVILALHHGTRSSFVNLGSGKGYSIKELVETLNSFIPFNYKFDTAKSSGFPKRVMDISLARESIDYDPATSLPDGLKATWAWFLENQKEYLAKKNYFNE
ncbi:NAD-dependent epimerase/dehydratase family protein [Elusimicrobiota bacterium]